MPAITSFTGDYRFLSNFYPATVYYRGLSYPSVEHAYQSAKTTNKELLALFSVLSTAAEAKKLGRSIAITTPNWEDVKIRVMLECVRSKFTNSPELLDKLLATGEVMLIEGNTWGDTFWGVCGGRGENQLGKILMVVRGELRGD